MQFGANIEQVSWADVRDRLYKLKPRMVEIIDEISPSERPPLFMGRYPFGSNMVEAGKLMLPSADGKLVPVDDDSVPRLVQKSLNYASIPLCVWLNTSGEVYVQIEDRRVPLNVFMPGSICGLWEVLDSPDSAFAKRIWSIAVGARSIFTLPKISDTANFNRIEKKYNLRSMPIPKSIFEQSDFFSQVINSDIAKCSWYSEILFFSKDWFNHDKLNKDWLLLYYHLLREEWAQSIYWRNKVTFDLVGQIFSLAQSNRNLKPNPYLIDTAMYLVSIGIGYSPAFMPVSDEEIFGPIKYIQKIITEDYGLKNYVPTLMCPNYLEKDKYDSPVYYSMQVPTMLGTAPNLRKPHSVLDDIRMVKRLLESLKMTLEKKNDSIFELIKNIDYEFFHTDADNHGGIKNASEMPMMDNRLIKFEEKGRVFCETSSFLRGCVKITRRRSS